MQHNPPPIPPVEPYPKPPPPSQGAGAVDFQPAQVGCAAMFIAFLCVSVVACLICGPVIAFGGEVAANILIVSFSLASIGWVFFDAMALKTGRGQVAGFVNMPPWAWALSFFLFCLIAFPIYLAVRPEIIKVNEQYPDGPPVTGKTSGSSIVLIAGMGCLILSLLALIAIAVLTVIGKQISETNPEFRSTATQVQ